MNFKIKNRIKRTAWRICLSLYFFKFGYYKLDKCLKETKEKIWISQYFNGLTAKETIYEDLSYA